MDLNIKECVELLGLEISPKSRAGAQSFNVRCPFCDKPGAYHMNINVGKNVYFCPKCMDSATDKHTGVLDLYSRVKYGMPMGNRGSQLMKEYAADLEKKGIASSSYKQSASKAPETIYPAKNSYLNYTYSALSKLPYLRLSNAHRENLHKRGLDDTDIARDRYFTFPKAEELVNNHLLKDKAEKWFIEANIAQKMNQLQLNNKQAILAGYLICEDLSRNRVNLNRVPGFFKIGGHWCFKYQEGMGIFTRNLDGKILGIQVRTDIKDSRLRYLTVSSKGLPHGVNCNIARTHFAHLEKVSSMTTVYLTEGPLKSNVIVSLLKKRGYSKFLVIGIQGVKNTRDLPNIAKYLRETYGIKTIYNALDMDKCTNVNVSKAGVAIRKLLSAQQIEFPVLCWDSQHANIKFTELSKIYNSYELPPIHYGHDLFINLCMTAEALNSYHIEFNHHWNDSTKGLDDYLLSTINSPSFEISVISAPY